MDPASKGTKYNYGFTKETIPDEKQIVQWIASRTLLEQEQVTREHFQELLESASQPRHASGNACVKLCYFVEQCRKSNSATQREVAFSYKTCLSLFNFYVEWNEKNQHRSMRQVLELLVSLIMLNPDKEVSSGVKIEILELLISIITHKAAQPLVKPAFKALECFLGKGAISANELRQAYCASASTEIRAQVQLHFQNDFDSDVWHSFVYAVFEWMSLPDTSPAAGKLLVTLFKKLRETSLEDQSSSNETHTMLWQKSIRTGLMKHPDALENIKNYLFPPLFKLDKVGSQDFLHDLVRASHFKGFEGEQSYAQEFLFLSAMEVGKKIGLVNEPNERLGEGTTKAPNSVILPEDSVGRLLSHKTGSVRSAAFSLLVSSMSSVHPFSSKTFNLFRQSLRILHSDTDAKVRNEVLSNTKHMIGRMNGAVLLLTRQVATSSIKRNQRKQKDGNSDFTSNASQEAITLKEHEDFILWYHSFLTNELIPTASYQRHITALRAIQLVADTKIQGPHKKISTNVLVNAQAHNTQSEGIFTQKMMRLLLDLLLNPFEDVRAAATQLLKITPELSFRQPHNIESDNHINSQVSSFFENGSKYKDIKNQDDISTNEGGLERFHLIKVPKILSSSIQKAGIASRRTGRADLADGVARIHELTYCIQTTDEARLALLESLVTDLEMKVLIAEKDLAQAVLLAPVHGYFASLRMVWELASQPHNVIINATSVILVPERISMTESEKNAALIGLQYRMMGCCTKIWAAVKEVLCNDSPEGHLPQDLDHIDVLDTKDVLSYSFRAIHESSNLLRAMVSKLKPKLAEDSAIMPFEVFQAAGNLSFEQLSSLRHRGAISTVSLTFARCCQLTQGNHLIGQPGTILLKQWYQGALMCIHEQSSTTRRSAGIPALITGILSAMSASPALEDVMAHLKTLTRQPATFTAKDETYLPQVHAMNCLKEIFKSSTLGRRCDNHIADCLQIAAGSLKSKIWAIRNCGLLLLRSLVDCLFGTSESKIVTEAGWDGKSIRLAYERYPMLPEILLNLMAAEYNEQVGYTTPQIGAVESVFPALDIIRRAGPPKRLRSEIYASIKSHLGSNIWHIRDIAARTICTLLLDERWLGGLTDLLETCGSSSNQIHGLLLATKYLLERRLELNLLTDFESLIIFTPKLDHFWTTRPDWMLNSINEAAYIEVGVILQKIARFAGSTAATIRSEELVFERVGALLQDEHIPLGGKKIARNEQPISPEKTSILLFRAVAIRALYAATKTGQIGQLQRLITSTVRYDVDIACDLLDHMSVVWNIGNSKAEDMASLVDMYIGAYSATSSNSIRTIALRNLANILEYLLQSGSLKRAEIMSTRFHDFGLSLLGKGCPDLSNAELRMTGSLLALNFIRHAAQDYHSELAQHIQAWGDMLSDKGKSENDFDARYAAVAALRAFYCACGTEIAPLSQLTFFVPSLLALYDTLNDDDDEIRDVAAIVVSNLLKSHQAPLAASARFLEWLRQNFGKSKLFRAAMMNRIANSNSNANGILEPAELPLAAAMLNDDSLFVEEKQNLYIDEVTEATAWNSLLALTESSLSDEETSQLSSWVVDGLYTLARLAETEDGPFGWSSKPRVFGICLTIILAANAITGYYQKQAVVAEADAESVNGTLLLEAAHRLLEVGRRNHLHPVLLDELAKTDIYWA